MSDKSVLLFLHCLHKHHMAAVNFQCLIVWWLFVWPHGPAVTLSLTEGSMLPKIGITCCCPKQPRVNNPKFITRQMDHNKWQMRDQIFCQKTGDSDGRGIGKGQSKNNLWRERSKNDKWIVWTQKQHTDQAQYLFQKVILFINRKWGKKPGLKASN